MGSDVCFEVSGLGEVLVAVLVRTPVEFLAVLLPALLALYAKRTLLYDSFHYYRYY